MIDEQAPAMKVRLQKKEEVDRITSRRAMLFPKTDIGERLEQFG